MQEGVEKDGTIRCIGELQLAQAGAPDVLNNDVAGHIDGIAVEVVALIPGGVDHLTERFRHLLALFRRHVEPVQEARPTGVDHP